MIKYVILVLIGFALIEGVKGLVDFYYGRVNQYNKRFFAFDIALLVAALLMLYMFWFM